VGNGRREVLAAAKNPEKMDDSIVFLDESPLLKLAGLKSARNT